MNSINSQQTRRYRSLQHPLQKQKATFPFSRGVFLLFIFLCTVSASGHAEIPTPTQDFTSPEADEALSGGTSTQNSLHNRHAFSQPFSQLSLEQGLTFNIGKAVFEKIWVSSPSSTTASDGLGPLYNARSCVRCHKNNGRGVAPSINQSGKNAKAVSLFLRLSVAPSNSNQRQLLAEGRIPFIPDPVYGQQLQTFAYPGGKSEGKLQVHYNPIHMSLSGDETLTLNKPHYEIKNLGYGKLDNNLMTSPRIAPAMIGLGLLEAIETSDLLALSDPDDSDNDGISGRVNMAWNRETKTSVIGRFGWKAGTPNLAHQNGAALNGDLGIGSTLFPSPYGDCTERQIDCWQQANGNSAQHDKLEASQTMTELLLFYTRHLAVPARRTTAKVPVLEGKKLFYQSGCIGCHTPKFITAKNTESPGLSEQLIWPYSDLLLHDMGDGLADNRPEYHARGNEWRTPPLWGIGLTSAVSGEQFFLHDGRARSLMEAIIWHGGEAEHSKQNVINMSPQQRRFLLKFLESL